MRGTGMIAKTFTGGPGDLNRMTAQAAEYLYSQSQPALYVVYLVGAGRDADAITAARASFDTAPEDQRPVILNAWGAAVDDANTEAAIREALKLYRAAIALKPDYWVARFNEAGKLQSLGDEEGAWQAQQAMEKSRRRPARPRARTGLHDRGQPHLQPGHRACRPAGRRGRTRRLRQRQLRGRPGHRRRGYPAARPARRRTAPANHPVAAWQRLRCRHPSISNAAAWPRPAATWPPPSAKPKPGAPHPYAAGSNAPCWIAQVEEQTGPPRPRGRAAESRRPLRGLLSRPRRFHRRTRRLGWRPEGLCRGRGPGPRICPPPTTPGALPCCATTMPRVRSKNYRRPTSTAPTGPTR